jgi:hypothetical protein
LQRGVNGGSAQATAETAKTDDGSTEQVDVSFARGDMNAPLWLLLLLLLSLRSLHLRRRRRRRLRCLK